MSNVICRTIGHSWDSIPVTDPKAKRKAGEALVVLRCTRCTSHRLDRVEVSTGIVLRRAYAYSDGYLVNREDRLPKVEWRRQFLVVAGIRKRVGR